MGGWLSLVPRWVSFVVLGAILAAGALFWAHRAGYNSGRIAERLETDRATVAAAEKTRATAGAAAALATRAAAPVTRAAAALHDSARVVDTVTVTITLPGLGGSVSTKQNVEIPAIIVRRLVADSLSLGAKDAQIATLTAQVVADSGVIRAQGKEITTLTDMKTPICGGRCRVAVDVGKVAIVAGAVVSVVRWLTPRH